MSFYISSGLTADPAVKKQQFLDYLTQYAPPGFALQPGDPIDLVAEAAAIDSAAQEDVIRNIQDDAFRYVGGLFGIPAIDAVPATSTATFTVKDTAGYTVDAGAVVAIRDTTGTLRGFDLLADVVIAPGASTGTGTVQAEDPGVAVNGLSGTAQLVQTPPYVTGASLSAAVGGVDAEETSVYLDRLAETFTVATFIPVLAPGFAILARSIPGVFRAAAVNLLKPGPPYDISAEATGVEKNVTVAVTDVLGQPVGSTIRGNVQTLLSSLREQNFQVWAVDAQYTIIDVTANGVYSWPDATSSDVRLRVIAALQNYLSPALYGSDGSGNTARWLNDPIIRAAAIHQTIMSVQGVRYVDPVPTFGVHGGSLATTDVTLGAGSAIPALPTAGTITVTVTPTSP